MNNVSFLIEFLKYRFSTMRKVWAIKKLFVDNSSQHLFNVIGGPSVGKFIWNWNKTNCFQLTRRTVHTYFVSFYRRIDLNVTRKNIFNLRRQWWKTTQNYYTNVVLVLFTVFFFYFFFSTSNVNAKNAKVSKKGK